MMEPVAAKAHELPWQEQEAAELRAELHLMKTAGIIEVDVRNPSVAEYMAHWEGRATDAEARIRELEEKAEDADQLRRLFDQQWKRTREAGELWRQAHPGNDNVSPDLGELVKWLMDRAEAAEALLKEAGPIIRQYIEKDEIDGVILGSDINRLRAARAIHDKIGVKDE